LLDWRSPYTKRPSVADSIMRLLTIFLLLLAQAPPEAHAQDTACSCDREQVLANVRDAETIFYGSIEEARMESAKSGTIQLTIEIRDPIRSPDSGSLAASTTLPHECGISATLGMHSLFVITKDSGPITRCGGSGSHYYQEGHELYDLHNLVFALIAVEYADKNPSIVRSWLNRTFSNGYSRREHMESFFALIGELDTETIIAVNDNEVTYRNIVFVFTDNVLVDYFWKDRN
jgi:hypothetical protein